VKEWIYRRFNYPCARYPDLFFFSVPRIYTVPDKSFSASGLSAPDKKAVISAHALRGTASRFQITF